MTKTVRTRIRMSFEEIPHTADVKIHASAPTLEELFSETFKALMQVMYGTSRSGYDTGNPD